ncbi:hypothetical protein [Phocaeicola plebeius]|jgi:hypothetical protein|uniref:DUF3352 domain-containing protein n=1 Tax=Phocaeicola plebeius TaxID=310297 RepID=A0A921HIF6_9BACT|nr:hypothetical protein [Phocaeicola plebeius]MCI6050424.1 DUF3352 domain-containing protein [Phocaeicola plebeius]MDD6912614.1 hypothetical protein [Phocaeicola plebeius]MDY5979295.1 hypothetical protein [Phocaeicola plebeius]RGQ75421.1 hypothetical protein DWY86_01630 [Phocaeicola plebeius]RGQ92631.1 hypothetical protein DWY72_08185 [Phocaeicola plebeius]
MQIRSVIKLGVVLSVVLFCIGIAFYGFARLSMADKENRVDIFEFVPKDCAGILETDNIDNFMHVFSQAAYSSQLDTLHRAGLMNDILSDLSRYSSAAAHGLSYQMNHVVISFHRPHTAMDVVAYFRIGKEGKHQLIEAVKGKHGADFIPKKETYRGKKIEIYPLSSTRYLSVYTTDGLVVVSYQKKLIEQVIDAVKDNNSLREDSVFTSIHHPQPASFITIYGRTPSVPFLGKESCHSWSEYDIHLNSEVFYLSGQMKEEQADCLDRMLQAVHTVPVVSESDSLLVVSGRERVDSCISKVIASPSHTLFDECVSNLSRDASYIMVTDMEKVAAAPEQFASYLPPFLIRHADLFRSFILSIQFTEVNNRLSHIFVFTYKE